MEEQMIQAIYDLTLAVIVIGVASLFITCLWGAKICSYLVDIKWKK